jgi:multidrug resistance protein, MATE family
METPDPFGTMGDGSTGGGFADPAVAAAWPGPRGPDGGGFGEELRALLRLATPIVISQLGQVGMNTADTIMVGPLGAEPLAAVGLGSALHIFGIILSTGVILGMAPLVAQAHGAGRRRGARRVLVQGLWLAALLSVPIAIATFLGGPMAGLLGQDPAVTVLVGGYMRALAWGVLPVLLFTAFRQYLEGIGRPTPTMVVTFIGLGINILANYALIYGVDGWIEPMGVVGSGWATTIVRWAMLAALLLYVLLNRQVRLFHGVRLGLERRLLARMTRIGWPIGVQFGLEVGLFSFAAIMMGWLGPVELAAHQVTINLASTTFMVALGTSMGGSIRVGQHIGAGRTADMRRAVLATYLLVTVFMTGCALLFLLLPHELIRLYTPDSDVIALGARLLLLAALFQVFDGGQVAGMAVLRGAADTEAPMLIAATGYWLIGVPVAYILAFRTPLGPLGIWAGLSVGLAVVAVLLALRVRKALWIQAPE